MTSALQHSITLEDHHLDMQPPQAPSSPAAPGLDFGNFQDDDEHPQPSPRTVRRRESRAWGLERLNSAREKRAKAEQRRMSHSHLSTRNAPDSTRSVSSSHPRGSIATVDERSNVGTDKDGSFRSVLQSPTSPPPPNQTLSPKVAAKISEPKPNGPLQKIRSFRLMAINTSSPTLSARDPSQPDLVTSTPKSRIAPSVDVPPVPVQSSRMKKKVKSTPRGLSSTRGDLLNISARVLRSSRGKYVSENTALNHAKFKAKQQASIKSHVISNVLVTPVEHSQQIMSPRTAKRVTRQHLKPHVRVLYRVFHYTEVDRYPEVNQLYQPKFRGVYQDMSHPLSHYFISSGHNSYLTGNQLTSKSGVKPLIDALSSGCRVLELDVWSGKKEPKVTHGFTMTKSVTFSKCIRAIKKHAFRVSEFPVIITLENHCNAANKAKMVEILTEELGDMIYRHNKTFGEFPSPRQLRNKILIRDKDDEEKEIEMRRANSTGSQGSHGVGRSRMVNIPFFWRSTRRER